MSSADSFVQGREKMVSIFGYWPSFHDAEVLEFNLSRGHLGPEHDYGEAPEIIALIHLFQMTSEIDPAGYFGMKHHTLATLRFCGVEDLELDGFNHQNAILGFEIAREEGASARFTVDFTPAYGLGASFTCASIEVIKATPCTSKGVPLN